MGVFICMCSETLLFCQLPNPYCCALITPDLSSDVFCCCCCFLCFLFFALPVVSGHFPDPHSCITAYLSWQLLKAGVIALSYADVSTVQRHSWNNSCAPLLFFLLQLASHLHYWLSPTCLIWRPACCKVGWDFSHCMQRSCSAPDKWPQLPNERQLHHCLHVTDGWQCWQTGGINWRGYQGQTSLHFRAWLFFFFSLLFFQCQGAYLFKCRGRMRETVGLVHMFC